MGGSINSDAPSRALPVEPGAQPLTSLTALVEAATGPDREIDRALWATFQGGDYPGVLAWDGFGVAPFTASLDAALALVGRVLPGAYWRVERLSPVLMFDGEPFWASCGPSGAQEAASAETPALAMVLALLRAIEAQPNQHDARDGASRKTNGIS